MYCFVKSCRNLSCSCWKMIPVSLVLAVRLHSAAWRAWFCWLSRVLEVWREGGQDCPIWQQDVFNLLLSLPLKAFLQDLNLYKFSFLLGLHTSTEFRVFNLSSWEQCSIFLNWSVGKHLQIQFLHRSFFLFSFFFLPNTFMWIGKGVHELLL